MRKLWNRPDYPVWSLVTQDQAGTFNMNIVSYVTAVSMEPKVMLVAVYHGTKSRENLVVNGPVRLQLLTRGQASLVRLLGQQSGKNIPKLQRLEKRGLLSYFDEWPYLTDSAGYLDLVVTNVIPVGIDHDVALCTVRQHRNLADAPLLTTTYLKEHKFTR